MTLLVVERADASYGDLRALTKVSLEVDAGETVAIIGANGAGKSTLLRVVAGLTPIQGGAITLDGRPIHGLRADRRARLGISLVPEGRRVFPSLTVVENLLVGRETRRGGPWTVDTVFDLFPNLAPIASRGAGLLSGGEQQALAIGRALMSGPRLLLLDELSLGLAPSIVRQLYAVLPQIAAQGTGLVLVEQNIDQALQVADRAYCLLEGKVMLDGRPGELSRSDITSVYFGI